jgi:aryl carrier-like protein
MEVSMEDKSVVVTKIWSDMFGEKNTKDEDNFFELGGDSIMALKMSEQLKQKGYTISLMEVFDDSVRSQGKEMHGVNM